MLLFLGTQHVHVQRPGNRDEALLSIGVRMSSPFAARRHAIDVEQALDLKREIRLSFDRGQPTTSIDVCFERDQANLADLGEHQGVKANKEHPFAPAMFDCSRVQLMKIVQITSYLVPGFGYEELPLARAHVRMGHDVTILASNFLHPPGIFYGVLKARFPERRVSPRDEIQDGVHVIRLRSLELPGRRVWMFGLAREIRRLDPDVVHCHNLLQVQTVRVAFGKALGRPPKRLVVDDHMHQSVVRRSLAGRVFYSLYRSTLQPLMEREIDNFCAISEDTREYLRDMCGVRSEIQLRPLGVDVDAFEPSASLREEWRRRLNLGMDDLVLLYTGKLIAAKGVHVLVAAALRLLDDGEKVKVVLVGDADPHYVEQIKQRIAAAGRTEEFRFHPSVMHAELRGAYAAADIAIWPRQESMAVFEAMSAALPVVISNRSGYFKLVTSGPGVAFEHDDDESLAAELRGLFDPARRATLGAAGRALTERDYSWQRSAERYLQTYGEVAAPVAAGTT